MELQQTTYLDLMRALLEAGADPDARVRMHPWYLVYTGCGNGNCGLTSVVGSTAFWRAAYGTDVAAMRLLVEYGADPNIPTTSASRGGRGGGRGGRGGGRGGSAAGGPEADPSGLPPVPNGGPGVYPVHAVAGVEYGEGFAGNSHRHAPDGWLPAMKYLVEELGADVNARDSDGYNAVHHAAARGDNEMILYLVDQGADVTVVSRRGQTTADLANGPVQRVSPFPETVALLVKLGAKNNNRCVSCLP
jgi:ankyrin repeat protein